MSENTKSDTQALAEMLVRAIRTHDSMQRAAGRVANEVAHLRRTLKDRDDVIRHRDELIDDHRRFERGLEEHVSALAKTGAQAAKAKAVDEMCAFIREFLHRCPF